MVVKEVKVKFGFDEKAVPRIGVKLSASDTDEKDIIEFSMTKSNAEKLCYALAKSLGLEMTNSVGYRTL